MVFNTPVDLEPLPLYRRDPEVISIISSAPSYVSEAPTYRSRRPSVPEGEATTPAANLRSTPAATARANAQQNSSTTTSSTNASPSTNQQQQQAVPRRTGLPPLRYAPGFHSREAVSTFDVHAYNIGAWSSITTSHASRQLHAVARRRACQAAAATTSNMLSSLASAPSSSLSHSTSSIGTASTTASAASSSSPPTTISNTQQQHLQPYYQSHPPLVPEPLLPQEDPDLVGEIAAAQARSSRLYRERCLRGEEFRAEGRTWDFMFAQMTDWDERERSWRGFREQVNRTKLLSRRLGLR